MCADDGALGSLLRRDRAIVLSALATITLLAWIYLIVLATKMTMPPATDMPVMNMAHGPDPSAMLAPALGSWTPAHFLIILAMWVVMMIGMMTPSVAPMILIYARVARQAGANGAPFAPAGWFAAGYLIVWAVFSMLAAGAQWGLDRAALLTPMMASANRQLGGFVLIAVGLFQWTPLKDACMSKCQAPLSFVQRHGGFRPGAAASLRLGFLHGAYCVGCCWALMGLVFVGGVMNLLWISAIMIFILIEKVMTAGRRLSRAAGLAAIGAGAWMILAR